MRVYLAGKVPKGGETDQLRDWRNAYVVAAPWVEFLTPIDQSLDYSDAESVFGHDCHLIESSDAIIVDASIKLGVGTSQEILIAKYFKKFVICVAPRGSHHRKPTLNNDGATLIEDWIHPFIKCTADEICNSIDECTCLLQKLTTHKHLLSRAKGIDLIDRAIDYHLTQNADQRRSPASKHIRNDRLQNVVSG